VLAHRAHITDSGVLEQRRRFRLGEELREIVARRLEARARELCTGERWDELTTAVLARDVDPWSAADEMLQPVLEVSPEAATATPTASTARR
jgi:LAO/AO transport system kinase